MKIILILLLGISILSNGIELNSESFDWANIKQLHQIEEWRDEFSEFLKSHPIDQLEKRTGRVIGGSVASDSDFPFQVGLILNFRWNHGWCSGSLISSRFGLTAANCVVRASSASALFGASNINTLEDIMRVPFFKVHEKFDRLTFENDIALFLLSREAIGENIKPIMLAASSELFTNRNVEFSGWGINEEGIVPSTNLHYIQSRVISNFNCFLRFPLLIKGSNICTTVDQGTACNGDEGGGLILRTSVGNEQETWLIGIFSFQYLFGCDQGFPSVFTRVASYRNWISQNVNDTFT